MNDELRARVEALLDERGETAGGARFLSLLELDASRLGLATSGFVLAADDRLLAFSPATASSFVELVERPRRDFDDALAESARDLGLAGDDVVMAFPAIDLVRAVLAKDYAHTTRLALHWILPSELRELRDDILRVAKGTLSVPVRELAQRLVVAP